MERRFLLEQWNLAVRTLPPMPPEVKLVARRFFYAGAHQTLVALVHTFEGGTEATEKDLQLLTDIQTEAQEFAEAIVRGEA